ncbi:leucyl aminopeptidase [Sulfurospirillum arcachonense]|uniref:leucyl aminopeptidase n=1 Tax=Sulfurospirillum arcachonense TaxID=57666 RepID=UPI00046ADFA0|nr:leucyl aminopeptidase [Sulfurospirillum arcachonense]
MKIEISNKKISEVAADIKIVFVVNKDLDHKSVEDKETLEFLGFKGEGEEACLLADKKTVYVGIDSLDADEIRLGASKAINVIKSTTAKSIKIGTYSDDCPGVNIKAMSEAFILGSYSYQNYKSKKKPLNIETITICTDDYSRPDVSMQSAQKAIKVGTTIAEATNFSKNLVNEIPYEMHSLKLEEIAKSLESIPNVTCKAYGKEFLEEQGMGAFLAVNRASHIPPRLLHVVYKPSNAKEKFVYVGKGLTYDTGGLSLKPGDYMVSMKSDMGGGAAVLGILKGAAELELPYEIHAIVGATENAIGPEAYKPDDVLTAKNGTTIEVRNTDAEGRLVLADCLAYACEQKPDYLIDMATLTGACVVALGDYTTGVMGHSSELKHSLMKSANKSGELTGTLPFNRYLKKLLKSSIADVSNISSSRYGGAITAGMFLDNFVEDEYKDKWLHLDIAGPAYVEKDWGYNQCGASGAGVRMNLYWMIEKSKEEDK